MRTNKSWCLPVLIARIFGVGCLPVAPGTWGSAVAVGLGYWCFFPFGVLPRVGILAGVCILGWWASSQAAKILQEKDPKSVVIDELAGQWLVFLPFAAPLMWWEVLVGFILFRFFDAWKHGPVGYADAKFSGGFGIMIDDIIAGALACGVLAGIVFFAG